MEQFAGILTSWSTTCCKFLFKSSLGKYVPDLAKPEVEKAAAVLQEFHTRIISCRVSVTMQEGRHRKGRFYDVHITLACLDTRISWS